MGVFTFGAGSGGAGGQTCAGGSVGEFCGGVGDGVSVYQCGAAGVLPGGGGLAGLADVSFLRGGWFVGDSWSRKDRRGWGELPSHGGGVVRGCGGGRILWSV